MANVILGRPNDSGAATTGLQASSGGPALAVKQTATGSAVRGDSSGGPGGHFLTQNPNQFGVHAANDATTQASGAAVRAEGKANMGLHASSGGSLRAAAFAENVGAGEGVYGRATTGNGVRGHATSSGTGVIGSSSAGIGIRAQGATYGLYLEARDRPLWVGVGKQPSWFAGDLHVAGVIGKSACAFRIDHPLDPENKYLQHAAVESADMLTVYSGNVVTNSRGRATVKLPAWFEALNRDPRYQLTPIGTLCNVGIAAEIANSRFTIQSDKPKVKVSWQVTAIRNDAYAQAHRTRVEVRKGPKERGRYLHPEVHGAPPSRRLGKEAP
jgi:hypothetical protein